MGNLAAIGWRQLLLLWLCGLLIIPATQRVAGWLMRPQRRALARQIVLRGDRDRQMDSAYAVSLAADTANPVLLRAWKRLQVKRRASARRDSLLLARLVSQPADTAYDPYNESPAARYRAMEGALLGLFGIGLMYGVPITLAGFTLWWAYMRRARDTTIDTPA